MTKTLASWLRYEICSASSPLRRAPGLSDGGPERRDVVLQQPSPATSLDSAAETPSFADTCLSLSLLLELILQGPSPQPC
ncbi:hypothetical protein VTN00DRAFT_8134 [Thermoascus crustaceus]|uniref:uncharacterized protein n=1 Tax=Thermoascus crustaceus TaxID=5088 RepID=UPI003742994B